MSFTRTLAIFAVLCCICIPRVRAQEKDAALMFSEKSYDFGAIEESAGPVSHTFVCVNVSGKDVSLNSVIPSCACTTADYDHSVIPSGSAREIKVTYDPASLPGQFRQSVLVRGSDRHEYRLVVEGVVKERQKGVDEAFPYFVAPGIQVSSLSARFGFAPQGTVSSKEIGIVNVSDKSIDLVWNLAVKDRDLRVTVPSRLAPGETGTILVEYRIPAGRTGTLDNSVTICASGSKAVKSIKLEGYAVNPAKSASAAPSFRFEPTMLLFPKNRKSARFTIFNDGTAPLEIQNIEYAGPVVSDLARNESIPAGGQRTVTVRLGENASPSCHIRVFTNDPSRPMREIIIKTTK